MCKENNVSSLHHAFRLLRRKEVKTKNNYCQTGREPNRLVNMAENGQALYYGISLVIATWKVLGIMLPVVQWLHSREFNMLTVLRINNIFRSFSNPWNKFTWHHHYFYKSSKMWCLNISVLSSLLSGLANLMYVPTLGSSYQNVLALFPIGRTVGLQSYPKCVHLLYLCSS